MIQEVPAVLFRQRLGEMLNHVQYRNDSILITRDGKPVAALVGMETYGRTAGFSEKFEQLRAQLAKDFASIPEEDGLGMIDSAVAAMRQGQ